MFGAVPACVLFAYVVLRDCCQFYWPSVSEAVPAVCQCQCLISACPAADACPGCPPAAICPTGLGVAVSSWSTASALGLGLLLIVFLLGYISGSSAQGTSRLGAGTAHRTLARGLAGGASRKGNGA
jgi:hypothetical protein